MSKHYHAPQFIAAIKGSRGIVTTIAQRVGCNWVTARRAIDGMPTVKEAYDAECETVLDVAESVVGTNIYMAAKTQKEFGETVDAADAKWYLSKKGKHRGYVVRIEQELTGPDGGPIKTEDVTLYTPEERLKRIKALEALVSKAKAKTGDGV